MENGFFPRGAIAALLVAIVCCIAAAFIWGGKSTVASYWDEADYLNLEHQLHQAMQQAGPVGVAQYVVWSDRARPPAYRLASLPVLAVVGADIRALRALSLAILVLSAGLIYSAVRSHGPPLLACLAAAAVVSSHSIIFTAASRFGTDYVHFLAIAATFWSLSKLASGVGSRRAYLLVLALAVGVGLLSKGSFPVVAAPALAVFMAVSYLQTRDVRKSVIEIGLACLGGVLIALPWWVVNFREASAYVVVAKNFSRDNYPFLAEAHANLIGPIGSVLFVLALLVVVSGAGKLIAARDQTVAPFLAATLAGVVPLTVIMITSLNHTMRTLAPALIPALMFLAVAAHVTQPSLARLRAAVAGIAVALAIGNLVATTARFNAFDPPVWSWEPVRDAIESKGLHNPNIGYIGAMTAMNPGSIALPWISRAEPVKVDMIWRLEQGQLDSLQVANILDTLDVVIVPDALPDFLTDNERTDNTYIAGVRQVLVGSKKFSAPSQLLMGKAQIPLSLYYRR